MTRGDSMTLIERIEAGEGDQADLLREAATVLLGGVPDRMNRMLAAEAWESAALCLVPAGYGWAITNIKGGGYERRDFSACSAVLGDLEGQPLHANAATPALALCIACLKAKDQANG